MKIGIYCSIDAGLVKDRSIDYIGVDKGVEHLLNQNIKPMVAIGDMDSIDQLSLLVDLNVIKYSTIKDDTDTALAIEYAINHRYNEIDLYGVTQNRMDHFMAVLALLEKYKYHSITIYDQINKIKVLNPGIHKIKKDGYKYFSIFAFDQSTISISQALYPLNHYLLRRDDPLCISNQMIDDYALIQTSDTILLFQTN